MHVISKERRAYVPRTGLSVDHRDCMLAHNCTVRLMVDNGRTSSESTIQLSDVQPFLVKKKNDLVALVKGPEGSLGCVFRVVGLPKYYSAKKPYEICDLDDPRARRRMDADLFTKVEVL